MQLVFEFRNLGSKIIYASFNKIIICTSKTTLDNAKTYVEFILKHISDKPLFKWIFFSPKNFWDAVLFKDHANYGALPARDENSIKTEVFGQWNVAEFLPKILQKKFQVVISDFILHLYKSRIDPSQAQKVLDMQAQRLYNLVGELRYLDKDALKFPKVVGSADIQSDNATLEFIKYICHIMALDKNSEDDILKLEKGLLKLINVREFSDQSEFKDPCASYTLPNVVCSYCSTIRDMDLLRDPDLLEGQWKCSICEHTYNKNFIESMLVEIVQNRILAYQIQDLRCDKCRQIKADNLSDICSNCSGKFITTIQSEKFRKDLKIFLNIAKYYKFTWLAEVTDSVLKT